MSKVGKVTVKDSGSLAAVLSREDLEGVEIVVSGLSGPEGADDGDDGADNAAWLDEAPEGFEAVELSAAEIEEYLVAAYPDTSDTGDSLDGGATLSAKTVTPAERERLRPLLAHYTKKAHPFTACVRDNRKRFGPATEKYCAVIKDLIKGTTKWRKGGGAKLSSEQDGEAVGGVLAPEIPDGFLDYLDECFYPEVGIEVASDGSDAAEFASRSGDYTKPELRERLKKKIMAGTKGGKAGQWSARKSQLLASEYEKEGGGYRGSKSSSQKDLSKWSKEDWQTDPKDSKNDASDYPSGMGRYFPRGVWEKLTAKEKAEVKRLKTEASKSGKQVAKWPESVKRKMSAAMSAQEIHDYGVAAELAASFDATNYNDDQWIRATILHLESPYLHEGLDPQDKSTHPLDRSKHLIPIRDASGTLDAKRMGQAVGELLKSSAPQEKVKRAAQELLRSYRQIDDNAPDRLLGLAGEVRNRYSEFSAEEWAGVELAENSAVDVAAELSGKEGERRWKIPAAAKKAAQWALDLRKKSGEDFGTDSGVKSARYIVTNDEMDEAHAREFRGYFKRHEKAPGEDMADKKTNGGKSAGLWGGPSMKRLTYGIANLSAQEAILTPVEFSAVELASPALTPEAQGGAELAGKSKAGFKRFWKNLFPENKKVNYTYPGGVPAVLDFSTKNLKKVIANFKGKAVGAVPLLMAKDDGSHSHAPELARGVIGDMRIKDKHLQVLVEPRSKEAETFLSSFPEVGISAKYYEDFFRASDKKHFGPTVAHAAVVWEPHIEGLGPFEVAAKLSGLDPEVSMFQSEDPEAALFSAERYEEVIDLSGQTYTDDQGGDPDGDTGHTGDTGETGNAPAELSKGGSMKFKEFRDGVPVFEDDQGNEVLLSDEDNKKVAAEMSAAAGGADGEEAKALRNQVAELSTKMATQALERDQDKIDHRLERDYQANGVTPAFINTIRPVLMAAARTPEAKVAYVELSADGNRNAAEEKERPLIEQLWKLCDHERENAKKYGVKLSGEQGIGGAESSGERGEDERDEKIKAKLTERNLGMKEYGKVAAEMSRAGEL